MSVYWGCHNTNTQDGYLWSGGGHCHVGHEAIPFIHTLPGMQETSAQPPLVTRHDEGRTAAKQKAFYEQLIWKRPPEGNRKIINKEMKKIICRKVFYVSLPVWHANSLYSQYSLEILQYWPIKLHTAWLLHNLEATCFPMLHLNSSRLAKQVLPLNLFKCECQGSESLLQSYKLCSVNSGQASHFCMVAQVKQTWWYHNLPIYKFQNISCSEKDKAKI